VREFYTDYTPPRRVFKSIRKLLDLIPRKYVEGLDCVVLTNHSGQPRRLRLGKILSSKGYVSRSHVLGLYHSAHRGKRAWIEIYVDKIVAPRKSYLWVPFMTEAAFADVLCHEIGHHIHATIAREHRDQEDVAETWKQKLFDEIGCTRTKKNPFLSLLWRSTVRPLAKLGLWLIRRWRGQRAKAQPEFRASARRDGERARR